MCEQITKLQHTYAQMRVPERTSRCCRVHSFVHFFRDQKRNHRRGGVLVFPWLAGCSRPVLPPPPAPAHQSLGRELADREAQLAGAQAAARQKAKEAAQAQALLAELEAKVAQLEQGGGVSRPSGPKRPGCWGGVCRGRSLLFSCFFLKKNSCKLPPLLSVMMQLT